MEQPAFFLFNLGLLPELRLCELTLKFRGFPDLVAHQVDADEAPAKRVSKHGKNKSNPSTSAEATKPSPSSQVGSVHALCESEWETVARNMKEALKRRDKRISELERELSLFKVRRPCSCLICGGQKGGRTKTASFLR